MKLQFLFMISLVGTTAFAASPCATVKNSVPEYDKSMQTFKGCKLKSVDVGSLYAKLGFKEGDVVNPKSSGTTKTIELYNQVKKQESDNQ